MRILLACDPATPHEDLLRDVRARTWPVGSEITVLAAVEQLPEDFFIEAVPDVMAHAQTDALKHAEELVTTVAGALRAGGLQAMPLTVPGDPHDAIVEYATTWGAELILLGAPRREDGFPSLNNRVARAVIRHAPCSVQIVRTGVIRKVLVPADGSKYSLAAAHSVAARTWSPGTMFEVMSVMEPMSSAARFLYPPHGLLADDSAEAERMRELAMLHVVKAIKNTEQILVDAGLSITDHVLINVDTPGKLIMEEATTWGADLIVMGSHGRRGIKRFLIGSVSESVAMHAGCSVEIVRSAG